MIFELHFPKPPLDKFIDSFVYHEARETDIRCERLLPDGNTVLIISFYDTPQYVYDNTSLKEIQACHHVWVSGIKTEPITIPSGKNSALLVVTFKPGMAAPFFPMPMSELKNFVVDGDLFWGNEFGRLRERLLAVKSIPERFEIAENFLLQKFISKLEVNPCVAYAVNRIRENPDQLSLGWLNQKIGYSQKHFISMFKSHVGLVPKSFLKIMRFQKAVHEIEQASFIDWPQIAVDCGFYDQAHFINDFKIFSGYTPEEYMKHNVGEYTNYIPIY